MKAAGIAFVQSTRTGQGSCAKPALFQGLSYAHLSSWAEKSIFYFSDGFTLCPGQDASQYGRETLAEIKDRNTEQVPIHTICIGPRVGVDENFLRQLAAQNGGTFSRILD